jgi:hypothetical protein
MSYYKTNGTVTGSNHRGVAGILETASLAAHVRYLGEVSLLMRGPASGHEYAFTPSSREHLIDSRDAEAMVNSGLFQRL